MDVVLGSRSRKDMLVNEMQARLCSGIGYSLLAVVRTHTDDRMVHTDVVLSR